MLPPPHMLPAKAPKPITPLRCAVTGKPAKYRDPVSGYGYADLAAYKELKQRSQSERRGPTGKRTKRQSSKSLGLPQGSHQLDSSTDAAQLANSAAQVAGDGQHTVSSAALDHASRQSAVDGQATAALDALAAGLPASPASAHASHTVAASAPSAAHPHNLQGSVAITQPPVATSATGLPSSAKPNEAAASALRPASAALPPAEVVLTQPAAAASAAAVVLPAHASPSTTAHRASGGTTAMPKTLASFAQAQGGLQDAAGTGK